MYYNHQVPIMSSRYEDVETALQERGWGVFTEAGVLLGSGADRSAMLELASCFGTPSDVDGGQAVWEVRPQVKDPGATFSQRAGEAGLHTDAAYREAPEQRFVLFCLRPAQDGGLTRLLAVSDLVQGLDPVLGRKLAVPQWRWEVPEIFGGGLSGRHPVLPGDGTVRWRADNLDVPGDLYGAARSFARHVEDHPQLVQLPLPADSMLVCDNLQVLHGRTDFADGDRSLVRIRLVTP